MTASVPWMMDGSALRADGLIADEADPAATSKCLAQTNKTRAGREATKKREKGTLGASAVLAGVQGTPEKLTRGKMKKLLFTTLAFGLLLSPANAQSWGRGGAYTGASPRAAYYPRTGMHWCTWSAANVCSAWRAHGGKFICPPGNMSTSCRLQRAQEKKSS
jgi:hypothetical protein